MKDIIFYCPNCQYEDKIENNTHNRNGVQCPCCGNFMIPDIEETYSIEVKKD